MTLQKSAIMFFKISSSKSLQLGHIANFKFDIQAGNVGWIADLAHIDLDLSEDTHIFGKYNDVQQTWSTTMFIPSARFEGIETQDIMLASSQTKLVHNTTFKAGSIQP